ncbi:MULTISPECIES: ABC transporter ATP-binding protein [Paenibacillus]|jgi:putative ABC transport system ATP-binding protein|uniref:ABC transport system ATP-binding protein n=1 Tax=Paenibacillus barengoltzii J12 TaxID=935846 RepID=A0ABY1LW15_9BACL|nr:MULTISPECIES: ABC transporter ATP-binding protein [Paenibacillus]MDU0332979.1 ABC transporter ATP-binding protein [Paenibacillus sp. 3LSP]MEC2346118.1 ABC transporter ATP-binding protein [Paenibacillus barengoltzii]SMF12973.1 putative ABC transport system ATP-binding protein [Paenibacillus barengoltzii J12]SMF48593.1 putative ABC transport system ATP-binding protein [Paenibacillus barengoltzii]
MITLKGITKVYKNGPLEVQALTPIDLHIEKGEFVAIMGSSGSGKSTLMNIIGCLDVPTSGSYELDGAAVESLNEEELARVRNRKIGFVFQSFNLLGRQTVLQNVTLPMMYAGISREERNERALELLRRVGLAERVKHRPNELSGGQKQRVAIARALTMNAPILLADEPTGNLDTKSSYEIMDLFKEIHAEGTTIVLVTHEPDIAEHAERIITFGDGRILSDKRKGSVGG